MTGEPVLEVRHLSVVFHTSAGDVRAVRDVSLSLAPGEVLAIVGESGSGKSVTAQAILGLTPHPPGEVTAGQIHFRGKDLVRASAEALSAIRGDAISMIFQDPMSSLNPSMRIGRQITEIILRHANVTRADAKRRAIELLRLVGIPEPDRRFDQYPHQFSGGMRQRIMIAIAIANDPDILLADEPTTALDVTIQSQIFHLIRDIQARLGMAMILITHDLGLVAGLADRIAVMYAGRVVEEGPVDQNLLRPTPPLHPRPPLRRPPPGRRRRRAAAHHRGPAAHAHRPARCLRLRSPLPLRHAHLPRARPRRLHVGRRQPRRLLAPPSGRRSSPRRLPRREGRIVNTRRKGRILPNLTVGKSGRVHPSGGRTRFARPPGRPRPDAAARARPAPLYLRASRASAKGPADTVRRFFGPELAGQGPSRSEEGHTETSE